MTGLLLRGVWYFSRVIRVRLELTTNGLKGHCRDVLNPDITELTETPKEVCPTSCVPFSQFPLFLVLFTNDGKSFSNRLKLNFAYFSVVVTDS